MESAAITRKSSIVTALASLNDLRSMLAVNPRSLFAILDACDEPRVPQKVKEIGRDRAVSLYRGWAERDYWAIAPYLVQVDDAILSWIVANLWNDPWGIFIAAAADLPTLRKHFRRFLVVETPDRRKVFFRYYDPRILTSYLTTADPAEVVHFFGVVHQFYVAAGSETLRAVRRANG